MPSSVFAMTTEQGLKSHESAQKSAIRDWPGRASTLFERIDASLLRTVPNRSTPPEMMLEAPIRRFVIVGKRLAVGRDPTQLNELPPTPRAVR